MIVAPDISGGIHILVERQDMVLGGDFWFWKAVDKAAKELNVPPCCPCGERPHRISCPLGFDNYFKGEEK